MSSTSSLIDAYFNTIVCAGVISGSILLDPFSIQNSPILNVLYCLFKIGLINCVLCIENNLNELLRFRLLNHHSSRDPETTEKTVLLSAPSG